MDKTLFVTCPLGKDCPTSGRHKQGNNVWREHNAMAHRKNKTHSSSDGSLHKDFHKDYEDPAVSVFSQDFTDVLYERYGDDPREVDKEREEIYVELLHARNKLASKGQLLQYYTEKFQNRSKYSGYKNETQTDLIEKINKEVENLQKVVDEKQDKYDAFNKKNPVQWQQYWLVTNVNGHLHKNQQCSTLHYNTQLAMIPETSGMNDTEVIEMAGHRVCTVCIPDAPVNIMDMATHVWSREEKEQREKKRLKEEEKIRKAEEKRRKAEERQKASQDKEEEKRKNGQYLDSEIKLPSLNMMYNNSTVSDVKSLDKSLKGSYATALYSMEGQDEDKSYFTNWSLNMTKDDSKHDEVKDTIDKYWDTDKRWVIKGCFGDVNSLVDKYKEIHDAIQISADKNNTTFDKQFNKLFGKRTLNTTVKSILEQRKRNPWQYPDITDDEISSLVEQRSNLVQQWMKNPESLHDYLNS